MANTFNVFKHRSRSNFDIADEPKKKKQKAKRTVKKKKSGTGTARPVGGARRKRTVYEDTVNISRNEYRTAETEEKLNTATLSAIKSKKKTKALLWIVLMSVIICSLVAVFTLACFNFLFKVESIKFDGVTIYNEDDVLAVCGIAVGDKMYSVDKDDISHRLISRFPYFKEVRIVREIPTGIVIKVTEDSALYYTSFCGEYCILSENMRVLDIVDDYDTMHEMHPGLLELKLPRVAEAIVGEKIVYFAEKNDEYIAAVMQSLLDSQAGDRITSMDLKSKFNISFVYDGRVTVEIGDIDSISGKIRFALSMLAEFEDNAKGSICARDVDNGYVILN